MSAVRMCDVCGRVFSENEDGWTTAPVQAMKRIDGVMKPHTEQRDACPEDSGVPVNLRPQTEQYQGQLSTGRKIARLEQEAGITEPE
jgi:hypothetical protein